MTDEELLLKTSASRGAAHRAPLAMFCTENQHGKPTGHFFLEDHTRAYADRGNEFSELMAEVRKRGLKMPPCDCPPSAHYDARVTAPTPAEHAPLS